MPAVEVGKPAGFTIDGPRGPAPIAQPGAVWLAKATGHPVLPFHLETVAIAMGEPFNLPADADEAAIERARLVLEERLTTLEARARAMIS